MRERWRRPLTLFQLAIFVSALAWIGYNIYYTTVPLGQSVAMDSLQGVGRGYFFALAIWHALAWVPGGLLLAAPSLAAERERGHLTDWILAGITPAGIVRAKFRALAGFVLVMVCVPFPIFALCFPLGGVSPLDFAACFALTVAIALNSVALGTLISASCATITRALAGALFASVLTLFFAAPLLWNIFGGSWGAPLVLTLAILWLPSVWVAAAKNTFAFEVERHIKNDDSPRFEPPIVVAPAAKPEPQSAGQSAQSDRVQTVLATAATPSFSQIESLILSASESNAIAHRDVKRRFVGRRANTVYGEDEIPNMPLWVWLGVWLLVGVAGLAMKQLAPEMSLLQTGVFLVLTPAMGYVALGAAPGFTQERAKKMLSALQMTALSPRDIVVGKVAGVLLLCAQYFGGPLLALCVTALGYGPRSALTLGVFGVCCVVFTAMGSLTLSLWSRKTEIVALGALASIAALWWVLPTLYINNNFGLFFRAPRWLELLWLAPIRVVLEPSSDLHLALALAQLSAICAAGTLIAGGLCVRQLRRTRAEEEASGLLQRDLSRGWR